MRKLFAFLMTVGLLLPTAPILAKDDALSKDDQIAIIQHMNFVVEAISAQDFESLDAAISAPGVETAVHDTALFKAIKDELDDPITFDFDFLPLSEHLQTLGPNTAKISGTYSASSKTEHGSWSVNGLSTYFIVEKQIGTTGDRYWYVTDTNFHKKIGSEYTFEFLKTMFVTFLPLFILFLTFAALGFAFVIWMLVDCVKRDFKDKTTWVVIIILLNFPGAVVYYFMVKQKNISNTPATPPPAAPSAPLAS